MIMNDETELRFICTSWKAFLLEYLCTLSLGVVGFYFWINTQIVPDWVSTLMISASIVFLISIEISRRITSYVITNYKIIITQGILRQHKKNVYFHPLA